MFTKDFARTKLWHVQWFERVKLYIAGKGDMPIEEAISPKACDLGRWLYGIGLKEFNSIQEMRLLEKVHNHLHAIVKKIIESKYAGNDTLANEEFAKIEYISQKLIALINKIEEKVSSNR